MEEFVKNQIVYGLKYLPYNLLKSYFIPQSSPETKAMRKRGFLCGVCHPNEAFDLLREGEIEWVRFDVPFPLTAAGEETPEYAAFKARCQSYAERGFSVMAVTPFPNAFLEHGVDPRTPAGEEKVRQTAAFLADDLQGFIGGFQISNEMGLPKFTLPLTLEEAARFIGVQAEAMYPRRKSLLVGYNSGGPEAKLHALLRPYHKFCDYVGVDIYLGCFDGVPGTKGMFAVLLRSLWAMTGKPVIVQEFGYISSGAPKTKAQRREILRSYGIEKEADARGIMEEFITRLPETFQYFIRHDAGGDSARYFDLLFRSDYRQHFYRAMSRFTLIPGYSHTPEGQAKFFDDLIGRIYRLPFAAGTIVYCWSDAEVCGYCGQPDCPVETRWGLVDCDGRPKPSFYAVQRQFGRIRKETAEALVINYKK